MIVSERAHLSSQLGFLRDRLEQIPSSAFIMRNSTESRIRTLEEQLSKTLGPDRRAAVAQLTFRGRPVIGSHGVYAEFALKAVGRFVDAVSAIAASFYGPLASMGPIPNKERVQLLIVGTALGSFGFELEEAPTDQLPLNQESPVAEALEQTQKLFAASIGSDEELAEVAAGFDNRALGKIRDFLSVLSSEGATCALSFRDRTFGFANSGDLQRSLERLGTENLSEREVVVQGSQLRALDLRRQFEMVGEDGVTIIGRVTAELTGIDEINRRSHMPVRVKLIERIFGSGRPRFVLVSVLEWPLSNS